MALFFARSVAAIGLSTRAQEIPALRYRFGRDDAVIGLQQIILRTKKATSWAGLQRLIELSLKDTR